MSASKRKFNFDDAPPPKRDPPIAKAPIVKAPPREGPRDSALPRLNPYQADTPERFEMELRRMVLNMPLADDPKTQDWLTAEIARRARRSVALDTSGLRITPTEQQIVRKANEFKVPPGNHGQVMSVVVDDPGRFGLEFMFLTALSGPPKVGDYIRFKYDATAAKWIEMDRNRGVPPTFP